MANTKSYKAELFHPGQNQLGSSESPGGFFRKDGQLLTEKAPVRIEVGRESLDGSYYIHLKANDGQHMKATMRPDQMFDMCTGLLVAMARWGWPAAEDFVKIWKAPR